MSTADQSVQERATALEARLTAAPFLNGDLPTAEDAVEFEKLLGADNMNIARWAKHIASFTPAQRRAFAAAGPQAAAAVAHADPAREPRKEARDLTADEKRDQLISLQKTAQQQWEETKAFEVDPPKAGEENPGKFMATFPYPYMNGKLHLGHAFSLLKAEFAVSFQRLEGKKALFPFGFHCTGMPIQAASGKLTREYEKYGSPAPKFPCGRPSAKEIASEGDAVSLSFSWAPPTSTAHIAVKSYTLEQSDAETVAWTEAAVVGTETVAGKDGKPRVETKELTGFSRAAKYIFRVTAHLEDGTSCEPSKASDKLEFKANAPAGAAKKGKAKGPAKIAQKSGDAMHQWDIMRGMDIAEEDIVAFTDPVQWLDYFPPRGADDLRNLGVHVDFRRSFITTDVNPFYDRFVTWQFNRLKEGNYLAFGKRPTIYSELDKQACMDHDRSEGEGVGHAEYTALKVTVVEPFPACLKALVEAHPTKPIHLLCGTLRPETMIGQTNCWILPEGQYGVFNRGEEFVVCSDRVARNMSFQDKFPEWGKTEKVLTCTGKELIGASLSAPLCPYKVIHLLPMTTIKMDKMTGIVTSVPADSPEDYLAFTDLKKKEKQEFFGLKPEWVDPFELVPLIDVEMDGEVRSMAAEYVIKKLGRDKIQEAHDECYSKGFYFGIMSTGEFKGMKVQDAKLACREKLIKEGHAFLYHEPEKLIVSRTGDECVVALIDQWYLKYGDNQWKQEVLSHVENTLDAYTPACKKAFTDVLEWLKEWACSRSFGLGTRIPWDKQFLIESLSDSTIYMAYYTMAKYFHGHDNLKGDKPNPYGIKASDVDDALFTYVLLGGEYPAECKIDEAIVKEMRAEFEYWYPMDLRVSGKDLIQNHLTMSLYNHAAIWKDKPSMWPRSFYTNGWVLVDNEKMSKSKGNFMTVSQAIDAYSADGLRIGCAFAGDSMEDANFEVPTTKKAVMRLHALLEFAKEHVAAPAERSGEHTLFADKWLANEITRLTQEARTHYSRMRFKEALRCVWYDFHNSRDTYLDAMAGIGQKPHHALITRWLETIAVIMSVIAPHACESVWSTLGKEGSVLDARFPTGEFDKLVCADVFLRRPNPPPPPLPQIVAQGKYLYDTVKSDLIEKHGKAAKKKPTQVNVYVAATYATSYPSVVMTPLV